VDSWKRAQSPLDESEKQSQPYHFSSEICQDSCKGNLKTYFTEIRDSLGRGESVVMAEVAYLSFVQLAQGENPLVHIFPPKSRPRTKAAAVSPEGYAFKDYLIQVTQQGFELMNAKMSFDEEPSPPRPSKKTAEIHFSATTTIPPSKN